MRYLLFTVLGIFAIGVFAVPQAFAEDAIVTNAPGSATPGCEETNSCFIPSTVTIGVGETVTWENTDTAAHTATAGSAADGPSGVFDSSLIMAGGSYSYTADTAGTFAYMCMVHPWMEGTLIVEAAEAAQSSSNSTSTTPPPEPEAETTAEPEPEPEQSSTMTITNAPGSSTPGCEETNSCFIPNPVTVDLGTIVTWSNTDTAAHTATSGNAADGPDGVWDSSLIMAGGSFSHTFDELGSYDYFCMVHPWMEGTVFVGNEAYDAFVTAQAAAEAEAQAAAEAEAQAAAEAEAQAAAEAEAEAQYQQDKEAAAWIEANPGVVLNVPGSSTPGCETYCFLPRTVTIEVGDTVTWANVDTAAHTTTSGSTADGPSGVFDSSLVMAGGSYSHTFYSAGTYDYFCMVHPWMEGTVIVEGTSEPEPETTEAVETEAEVVTESDEITTGSEIQIQTDIVNQQDGSQIFAYIVQIKYEDGTPISISTITGSLGQGQTLTQSISWTPSEPGVYVAEIFLWDDLNSANPLSTVEIQYFTVT